jgi:phosphoglycolate phosphatase
VRDTFPGLFGAAWEDAAALLRRTMAERHLDHLTLMPGADAMVQAASAWPMAVVSNKDGALLRPEVAHLGWTARFRAIVGAGDAPADKPRPDSIWHALDLAGLRRGRSIWYVGDNASDMQAAHAAGCTAVLLGDAAHDQAALGLHVPHVHYVTAADLAGALRALAEAC